VRPVALAHDVHGPPGAPVVVLGASIGTTRGLWDEPLPELARHFRVIRYDHRGHGSSPVPPGPYALQDLAADVVALMDSLGVDRAHHVGLSLGGMVAMQLAIWAPGRVSGLALVCTSAGLPPRAWHERAATVRTQGMGAIADRVVAGWFTPGFASRNAAARTRVAGLRAELLAAPVEGYAGCCEAIATMELAPHLGTVSAPTLVIAGAQDTATPPSHAHEIAGAIRSGGGTARVEIVDGAAHLASVERPAEITALLLQHLGACGEGPADCEERA
jgi:3-oxoadipate enol-lactonase